MNANMIFEEAINNFKATYNDDVYYLERDVVFTFQKLIWKEIREVSECKNYKVFHELGLKNETEKVKNFDLAITRGNKYNKPELAIEFKYLPSLERKDKDIDKKKYNQTNLKEILKDFDAIKQFEGSKNIKYLYSIFVDEGSFFKKDYTYKKSEQCQRLENESIQIPLENGGTIYIFSVVNENSDFEDM